MKNRNLLGTDIVVSIQQSDIDEIHNLEGKEYKEFIIKNTSIRNKAMKNLYNHFMQTNDILKSLLLYYDKINEKGKSVVIKTWGKGHNKNQETGIIAANVEVLGEKYICTIVQTRNIQKEIDPYAIRVFKTNDIQQTVKSSIVHSGISTSSQLSNSSQTPTETVANVLEKYLFSKFLENEIENCNISDEENGSDILNESYDEEDDDDEFCEERPYSLEDYDDYGEFIDGIAWAYNGEYYGYIDEDCNVLIPFDFERADDFKNGLAWVENEDGDVYYIDTKGNIIVDVWKTNWEWTIHRCGEFNCERTWVEELDEDSNSVIHCIDKKGNFVTPPIYDDAERYYFDDNGQLPVVKGKYRGRIDIYGFVCDYE